MSPPPRLAERPTGLLRFLTCGSVDDGKSTLIGRLLLDTKSILADALHAIERTSRRRGLDAVDLSLLTDGLQAEREQGITIDVAYRYFSTGTRKYIIADAPGHEQYTRNMVTAASTANLAVILVDARKGVLTQTRRHSYLAHLVGHPAPRRRGEQDGPRRLVRGALRGDPRRLPRLRRAARDRGRPLHPDLGARRRQRGRARRRTSPGTAARRCSSSSSPRRAAHAERPETLRFPVQWVCRPQTAEHHDFRGYMGRVESGVVAVGDEVVHLPSGRTTRVPRDPAGRRAPARRP